jgi:predicted small lipoprotein YifL
MTRRCSFENWRLAAVTACCLACFACGQTGPLTLPESLATDSTNPDSNGADSADSNDDDENDD